MSDDSAPWIWMDGEQPVYTDNSIALAIDDDVVFYIGSAHEIRLTAGSYFKTTVEIDGVEHEVTLSIVGVVSTHGT